MVDEDAGKPRADRGVAAEVADVAISGDVGFLQRVLGAAVVFQDGARGAVKPPVVAAHQRAESRLLPALHLLHEPGVGPGMGRNLPGFHGGSILLGLPIGCRREAARSLRLKAPRQTKKTSVSRP